MVLDPYMSLFLYYSLYYNQHFLAKSWVNPLLGSFLGTFDHEVDWVRPRCEILQNSASMEVDTHEVD